MGIAAPDLLLAFNLAGVFVFGLSGGLLGVRKQLDVFGVLVLATATALGGGIMRDLLIGVTPPLTLQTWYYVATAFASGAVVFLFHRRISQWTHPLRLFDAMGLALVTVTGTVHALDAGLTPMIAALLGMLSGIGGGVIRDVLGGEIPLVFKREIYALASLLGAAIIVVAAEFDLMTTPVLAIAAIATFLLRMVAVWRKWNAPTAHGAEPG